MNTPPVVSPEEWKTAREELLIKEKEHTRARDALAAERRRMPWTPVPPVAFRRFPMSRPMKRPRFPALRAISW